MKTGKAVKLRTHKGDGDGRNRSGNDNALAISNCQLPRKIKAPHSVPVRKQTEYFATASAYKGSMGIIPIIPISMSCEYTHGLRTQKVQGTFP